jgi:hypothetical protein
LFNTMQVETPPPTQIAVHASNMTTGNGGDVLQPRAFPLNNASAHRPSQTSPPAHVNGWMRSKNVRKKHRASMAEARFQHPTRFRSPPPPPHTTSRRRAPVHENPRTDALRKRKSTIRRAPAAPPPSRHHASARENPRTEARRQRKSRTRRAPPSPHHPARPTRQRNNYATNLTNTVAPARSTPVTKRCKKGARRNIINNRT